MLRKNKKLELLQGVPLFAGCSKRELDRVAAVADEIEFPAGATLMAEGQPGREFVVVVDGSVEVRRNGRKLPIRGGAEFFGEMALLTDQPRNATVTTTSPVRALVITDRSFRTVLQRSPSIALKILKSLAERIRQDT